MYAALIIDIIGSKRYQIDDRQELQKELYEKCKKLNYVFSKQLMREVDFSAGDELQGLFDSSVAAFLYIRFLMMLFPKTIRAGIGIGQWDVVMKNGGSGAQDGSAYHRAREAIDLAEKYKEYALVIVSKDTKWNEIVNELAREIVSDISGANETIISIFRATQIISPILVKGQRFDAYGIFSSNELASQGISYMIGAFPIFPEDFNSSILLENKTRGLLTNLAEAFDISIQSMQRKLRSWNIINERQLTIALCKLFDYLEEPQ